MIKPGPATKNFDLACTNAVHNIIPWFEYFSRIHVSCSFRVCRGPYDSCLISAWEAYDAERQSENDHPRDFTSEQVNPYHRDIKYHMSSW